jgi:hypothetical protein
MAEEERKGCCGTLSINAFPTSPICESSSPIRCRRWTVPCLTVSRVDTDETKSYCTTPKARRKS